MSENKWQKEFVAALVQGQIDLGRFKVSGLNQTHFSDPMSRNVVKTALRLISGHLEVNSDTIYTEFALEAGKKEAQALKSYLDILSGFEVNSSSYSQDFMERQREEMELSWAVENLYNAAHDGDFEAVKDIFSKSRNKGRAEVGYSITDLQSEQEYLDRHDERVNRASSNSNFHFLDDLHVFNEYLEVGIERQTLSSVAGATNVGKSIFLFNVALQAVDPRNGFNTLIIKTENRLSQASARWDSIYFDAPVGEMYSRQGASKVDIITERASKNWGKAFLSKMPFQNSNADTIARIIEDIKEEHGIDIDMVCVDSPDHLDPVSNDAEARWMKKADVYNDLKALSEEKDIFIFTTLPLKASTVEKKSVGSEGAAGAYDIAKLLDFHINILKSAADFKLGRRSIEIAKTRDGEVDSRTIYLKITPSLRFESYIEEVRDESSFLVDGPVHEVALEVEDG